MEKDQPEEGQWGQLELNQNGRPKQRVIFYELTPEMKEEAIAQLSKDQRELSEQEYEEMINCGDKVWDKFYKFHKCNFFRDRTYLQREMPEITYFKEYYQQYKQRKNYYQLGCGVGNTLFPLLRQFECFNYYGCDISAKAITLIQQQMAKHEEYKGRMNVKVCDLVKDEIPYQKVGDLNSMIFVLSAIAPEKHLEVMVKTANSMKEGSFLFFRDYGRYDFGQLNLASKGNRKLKDNFYRKNDGVCVYYFQEDQLDQLCTKAGLKTIQIHLCCKLLQNRKTGLKMYRVWIQGRFYKPPLEPFFELKLKEQMVREAQQRQKLKQEEMQAKKEEEKPKPEPMDVEEPAKQ